MDKRKISKKELPFIKTILSIGGSDCMGIAGIQSDVRLSTKMGWHAMTAVTAITAQNSDKVSAVAVTSPLLLEKQLLAISKDVIPDAVKIGMIGSVNNVNVIHDYLISLPDNVVRVLDPVFVSTIGGNLFDEDFEKLISAYREKIIPFVDVCTPNLGECHLLVKDSADLSIKEMAKKFVRDYNTNLIITGIENQEKKNLTNVLVTREKSFDRNESENYIDIEGKASEKISKKKEIFISENDETFSDKSRNEISINFTLYDSEKIECENLHGTGCLFSSLMAIYMSMNRNIENVFPIVCQYMERAISQSCNYRLGNSCYGPVNINEYAF